MKILITGHRGFIGQHAVEKAHTLGIPYVTHEWGEEIPPLFDVTHVMHFGAISSTTETDVEKVMRQNYDSSVQLLHRCNILGIHFQWSSSAAIYGLGIDFKETARPDPRNPYAWSKYLFERYVAAGQPWLIPTQGFRYFNVYGDKWETHKGDQASPYSKFRKQAVSTGVIKVFEDSQSYKRDFIHVDDVLTTQFQFLTINQSSVWNIGTGKPKSFLTVAEEIAAQYKATIKYIPMPDTLVGSYQDYTCADLTKLNTTLLSAAHT